jgi:hypothetical protein
MSTEKKEKSKQISEKMSENLIKVRLFMMLLSYTGNEALS